MLKKIFFLCLFISLPLFSVDTSLEKGAIKSEPGTYLGSFSKIKASGPFHIHLVPSSTSKLVLEGPSEIIKRVNVEIKEGVLHFRFKDGTLFNSGHQFIDAFISFEDLTQIESLGPSTISAEESLKLSSLQIHKIGSGSLDLNVDINHLVIVLKGSSLVTLKGESDEILLTALDSSVFDGSAFMTKNANIVARGSSKIVIHAKENLKVLLSGNAQLRYGGNPNLSLKKALGQSRVEPLN